MQGTAPTRGVAAGIFVVSLAILLLQIALTRLLSVVLWFHFAFVAISLAMLGLALAGVGLWLWPKLLAATERLLPWYCRVAGVTMVGALAVCLFAPPTNQNGSVLTGDIVRLYLVLLVPFTAAGLAVSATLAFHARHIGTLYARDLLGAGLGCLVAVPLLDFAGAPLAILAGSGLLLLGAPLFAAGRGRMLDLGLVLGLGGGIAWHLATDVFEPTAMHGVPDQDVASGRVREFAGWNSHSRIVVTRLDDLAKSINIDGHATTGIYRMDRLATQESVRAQLPWLHLRAGSMPFVTLGKAPDMLLIGPGGGLDLLNGIWYGARITAVELNGLIHRLMSDHAFGKWAGDVYHAPGVEVVHDEARSWVRRSDRKFDLIQASMIDTWAATAGGAFALAENSLYTVEAFLDYHAHLTDDGLVHFMRWNESPPRQSLRLLAIVVEAMRRLGDGDPQAHVVVLEEPQFPLEGQPMASLLWSKRPFTAAALDRLRAAVVERQQIGPVKVLCWPGESHDNDLSRFLRAADKDAFLAAQHHDVSPTTDDRPFFFHTLRLLDFVRSVGIGIENEEAVQVLGTVLVTVAVITLLAFVLPMLLTLRRHPVGGAGRATLQLGYFCCLGFGFMLVEIPVLQRFSLYVGHPTWTLATVLAALLLGAGLGGMRAAHGDDPAVPKSRGRTLVAIVVALSLLAVTSPWLLTTTLTWPFVGRVLMTIAVLTPLGWLLGQALPLGVRSLHASGSPLVAWAWGLNGATSVLASVLAVVIGMQFGFTASLVLGIACYLAARLLHRTL